MTNLKFLKRFLWRESQNEGHPPLERKVLNHSNFFTEKVLICIGNRSVRETIRD